MQINSLLARPTVTALVVPADIVARVRAVAGETDATATDDRTALINTVASLVEVRAHRMLWRSAEAGGVRRVVSQVTVLDPYEPVPVCPLYRDTGGVEVDIVSVRRWDEDASDWVDVTDHRVLSVGRLKTMREGDHEITVDMTPPEAVPDGFVEALAHWYSALSNRRPGGVDTIDGDGRHISLNAQYVRSGAADLIEAERLGGPF